MNKERYMNLFAKSLHLGLFILTCDLITEMNCMPTNGRDNIKEMDHVFNDKIEVFKRDVLNKLGYARPPNVGNFTKSIDENRRMIQQYKKYIEEKNQLHYKSGVDPDHHADWEDEDSKVHSKTFYSVEYEGLIPRSVTQKDWMVTEAFRFYFENLPTHPEEDQNIELKVESAKMRVFVKDVMPENLKDKHTVDKQIRVNVYQVLSIHNKTTYDRTLLDSILVNLDSPDWISFDISKAVQSWIDHKESNLGIEVAAESQNVRDVIDIDSRAAVNTYKDSVQSVNKTDTEPVLHIYAQQSQLLKRVKRRSRKRRFCRRKDNEAGCCRYPIKISFEEIGWDWILAPLEYKGYYCAGSCSKTIHKAASTFTGINVFLHEQKPEKVPAPCCHAAKLSPFTVLSFDEKERYTFTDIQDLIVEQCKCG